MGVIVPKPDSYFSNVFLTEKKDKSFRMILNLKTLNKHINYVHFKMESMMDVLHMITPGSYMASIDLTNAHYSIPVHKDHQKFLAFRLEGGCFEFTCLPNGYAQAPLIFTKCSPPCEHKVLNLLYILMTLFSMVNHMIVVNKMSLRLRRFYRNWVSS